MCCCQVNERKKYMNRINESQHFYSFAELGAAMGLKPVSRVTSDKNKLNSQREKFQARHLCPACKQPMEYISGTSVMVCKNPSCKGVKSTKTDDEGGTIVTYSPSFDLLDHVGTEIASNIFGGEA